MFLLFSLLRLSPFFCFITSGLNIIREFSNQSSLYCYTGSLRMVEIIVCPLTCLVLLAATALLYAAFREIHRARDNVVATVGRHQLPATSSSSYSDLAPCRSRSLSQTSPSVKRVTREPNVFHGNPSEFKEWDLRSS